MTTLNSSVVEMETQAAAASVPVCSQLETPITGDVEKPCAIAAF